MCAGACVCVHLCVCLSKSKQEFVVQNYFFSALMEKCNNCFMVVPHHYLKKFLSKSTIIADEWQFGTHELEVLLLFLSACGVIYCLTI